MRQKKLMQAFVVLVIGLLFLTADRTNASPYAFMVDRFEIVGNSPGSVVDNFDDNNIGPSWEIQDGTPFESSNSVHLQSPGELMEPYVIGDYIILEERSAISTIDPGTFTVTDGAGDFSASSKWHPVVPDVNQFYGIQMWSRGVSTSEDISFNIINVGPNLADVLGTTLGLKIAVLGDAPMQFFDISAADIVDGIILGMSFDDTNNLISPFFSLDNGSTILSPFAQVTTNLSDFDNTGWMLDVASLDVQPVPIPAAFWLLGSGLVGLVGVRRKMKK